MIYDVEREFPGPFWWLGKVVDRADPEGLGRIKAKIPARLDTTDWAAPFGFVSGNKRGGLLDIPAVGSPVIMAWLGGDINGTVVYIPGMFFRNWVPTGHTITDAGDKYVWQNDKLRVEIDTRDASAGLKVSNLDESSGIDQAGTSVSLELDFASGQVEVSSTLGLKLSAVGAVEIEGGSVTINGRVVSPGSKPL